MEGVIADYNLSLADLIETLRDFFSRLGFKKMQVKPAYNPYTEPSMEIFCYHDGNLYYFYSEIIRTYLAFTYIFRCRIRKMDRSRKFWSFPSRNAFAYGFT